MTTVVLPTANIVREFVNFEQLFSFYEEGLRGLVRDMVLLTDAHPLPSKIAPERVHSDLQDSGLLEHVMRCYEHSPESLFLERMGDTNHRAYVEMAVEAVYETVLGMMMQLFVKTVFELSKQRYSWLGDDLIAQAKIEKPEKYATPPVLRH